jgi:hypothetical protein
MRGPSHHYLPASFLGRYSAVTTGPLRERSLFALKSNGQLEVVTADNIGCSPNLYLLQGSQKINPSTVDDIWAQYESDLGSAISELCNPGQTTISAKAWLRVLVPFVTGLFVRGPEFSARYEARPGIKGVYEHAGFADDAWRSDNTNMSRLIEFQRLLAPVMAARWVVMHAKGDGPVITNELGYAAFKPPDDDHIGIAIPLDQKTILGLVPTWPDHARGILKDGGTGQWRAFIEHHDLAVGDHINFNKTMAAIGSEFLVGPTEESVLSLAEQMDQPNVVSPEMVASLWPRPLMRVAHEWEWHRLVTAIQKKSSELTTHNFQAFDAKALAKGWCPMLFFPINLPDFPTGIRLLKNMTIGLAMTEVSGFTDKPVTS